MRPDQDGHRRSTAAEIAGATTRPGPGLQDQDAEDREERGVPVALGREAVIERQVIAQEAEVADEPRAGSSPKSRRLQSDQAQAQDDDRRRRRTRRSTRCRPIPPTRPRIQNR